ncbi:Protein of unknown function [Cotesia congregata]|uniref:Uncharacterized protein n=1 Tax=Cotesia congregata TaxID=51543 RepID=A0A8J2HCV1_COTCN|nr:Protein of unknown function [Cotesia congregata]
MAAGFYVCKRNKEVVSGSELRNFRVQCDTEVEVMKNMYAGMIKYRLEKAGQRRILFNQVEDILYEIFSRYLPATFIHGMFFYFSNFELSKLVEIE